MKAITSLFFAAALATAGIAGTTDSQAARGASSGGGGSHSSGGHWGGGNHGSGHWGGGHYHGGGYWGPGWGFYVGAPLFYGRITGATRTTGTRTAITRRPPARIRPRIRRA